MKERFVLRESIICKEREYGGILVDPKCNEKTYLNETAFRILTLLDGESTVEDIAEKLSEEWGVSPDELRHDITEMVEPFREMGILVEDGKKVRPEYQGAVLDSATIEVTLRCNLLCKHCIVGAFPTHDQELPAHIFYDVIDQLADMQVFDVILTGGEPFLRPDFLDVLAYAQDHIMCTVFTNGTCIKEAEIKKLQEIQPKLIQVSLDGATPESHDAIRGAGAFEKTVQTIRKLVEANLNVQIATVVSKLNFHERKVILDFAKSLGVDALDISEVLPRGRARTFQEYCLSLEENIEFKTYYYEKALTETEIKIGGGQSLDFLKNPFDSEGAPDCRDLCFAFRNSLMIKANGWVIPCLSLDEEEFHMGNIREQPLSKIWNSPPYQKLRTLSVRDCQECSDCIYVRICGGGCRARTYQLSGDLKGPPEPLECESKKALYNFGLNKWKPGTTIEELYQLLDERR